MAAIQRDEIFTEITRTDDKDEAWVLLNKHISFYQSRMVKYIFEAYRQMTSGLITEDGMPTPLHAGGEGHSVRRKRKGKSGTRIWSSY